MKTYFSRADAREKTASWKADGVLRAGVHKASGKSAEFKRSAENIKMSAHRSGSGIK